MPHDEERMRVLWEEGKLTTFAIAVELGTTLDGVRGTARRRGWIRGPIPRGKPAVGKSPASLSTSPSGNLEVESPEDGAEASPSSSKTPRRSGKETKVAPPPEPPKPREEPGWSTVFTRLDEEHEKMDRVLAETRNIGRLQGL